MHSSPLRLYRWRYDHLHVPVVVHANKERRSTTDRSQYVRRVTVKCRVSAEPLPSLPVELHRQCHYARDRHRKTLHCTPHTDYCHTSTLAFGLLYI